MDGKEQVPTTASNDTVVVRVARVEGTGGSGAAEAAKQRLRALCGGHHVLGSG